MCLGGTTTLVCSPERFSTISRAGTIMRNRIPSNAHTLRRVMAVLMLIPLLTAACSMSNLPVARNAQPTAAPTQPTAQAQAQATPTNTGQSAAPRNTPTAQPPQGGQASGSGSTGQQQAPPAQGGAAWQVPAEQQAVVKVVELVGPAVVTVVNKLDASSGFSGEARGSGVIIDSDGHIITNNHVIEGAARDGLSVIFSNGDSAPATLVGA